jgi:hypothetical protein
LRASSSRRHDAGVLALRAILTASLGLGVAAAQGGAPAAGTAPFFDLTRSFRVDLPAGWRQLAPGEDGALRAAVRELPLDFALNEPRAFYSVGPVDRWLAGEFDGVYLHVVAQGNEWQVEEPLAERLQQMWTGKGAQEGVDYRLAEVQRRAAGREGHAVVTSVRTSTPARGRAQRSLDVSAPTGGCQLTLSFTCWAENFEDWRPRFERMLASLAFARAARGEQTAADFLWTPILTGGLVAAVLVLLYRRHRRRV